MLLGTSDDLPAFLLRLIDSDHHGGRITRGDSGTILLYDCSVWTDAHWQAVQTRFPECEIRITQCLASASGFLVVFRLQRDPTTYYWTTAALLVAGGIALTCRHVLGGV